MFNVNTRITKKKKRKEIDAEEKKKKKNNIQLSLTQMYI